jgi:hypothetical protein
VAGARESWLIAASDPAGAVRVVCVARAYPSRAIPLHVILRVERLVTEPGAATAAALFGLRCLAMRVPRVLRAHVELFDPEGASLSGAAEAARVAGFRSWTPPQIYERTVTLDLRPDEDVIFQGLHPTGRRHVRALDRHPVDLRPIGPAFPPGVLDALLRETLSRTGGIPKRHRWPAILELSHRRPDLSRVVGLFRSDRPEPDGLLAFAWGCHHGGHAHYATAASTRDPDFRIPLAYPLAWDLIVWARRHGATIFDFGGISPGTATDGDRLGGISDFKRRFTDRVVEVGAEWVFEPRPWRARAARWVSGAARLARGRAAP